MDADTLPDDVQALARRLAESGTSGLDADLRRLALRLRAEGASPVLADVLADPSEPEMARLRAFGRLMARPSAPARPAAAA